MRENTFRDTQRVMAGLRQQVEVGLRENMFVELPRDLASSKNPMAASMPVYGKADATGREVGFLGLAWLAKSVTRLV